MSFNPRLLAYWPTFAAWDVRDVFSRGLPVLETNFWMTRLIAGYKHSHLFLQGISVYFSFDVPKPTNPAEPLTPANWGYWETTNSTFPRHPLIFHRWNPQFGWSNQIFIVKFTLAQFSDKKQSAFDWDFWQFQQFFSTFSWFAPDDGWFMMVMGFPRWSYICSFSSNNTFHSQSQEL